MGLSVDKIVRIFVAAASSLAVGMVFLLGGCGDEGAIFEEIRGNRVNAYSRWEAAYQKQQGQGGQGGQGGQEVQIGGRLGLEDAVRLAMLNNKGLQAVVEQKEYAAGKVVESYSAVLPSVSLVGNYTRKDKLSGFDIGGQRINFGELDNYSADLQVRQPIYRGGAIGAALRAANLYELLSDEQVRGAMQKTIYEVAGAYFDTLLAQQLYKVNEDAVMSARKHLEDTRAKRREGVASAFDELRAEVDVSNFRAEMISQKNRINIAMTRLLKAMGVMESGQIELSDVLNYEKTDIELADAMRKAYGNRPDLYLAEYWLGLQKEAITAAKSEYWPQVYGNFTQGWSRPDPHSSMLDAWGRYWTAGVSVEWPLFSGMGREGRIRQEKALYRQRKYELMDTEQRAFLEVKQALLSLQDAEEFVDSQKMNLEHASEGMRLAEVGYREGVNTQVEVADAQAALTRAKGFYFQSLYQHVMARVNLQMATGTLGPGAGQKQGSAVTVKPGVIGEGLGKDGKQDQIKDR